MEIIDENTFVCVNKKFPNGLKLRRANIEFVIDESGNKVDSSTVFDKEENAVKANIELYSWVKEVKSNQEFQVIEIIDEETFVCVNEKHQDGIKLKRTEIKLVMV
jgi:ribosomal protein L14E/L6E/L27E